MQFIRKRKVILYYSFFFLLISVCVYVFFTIILQFIFWRVYKNIIIIYNTIIRPLRKEKKRHFIILYPIWEDDLAVRIIIIVYVLNAFVFIMISLHRWQSACG